MGGNKDEIDSHAGIWTIWINQPGHEGKYIVRRYQLPMRSSEPLSEIVVNNLNDAHALLPASVSPARRNDLEDPALIEIWMSNPAIIGH